MNLCFICPEYPPGPIGGVGTFTQLVARALVRVGHQVRVAGIYPSGYPAADYEEDQGVRVWRIKEPAIRFGWMTARIQLYRMIRSWMRAGQCDLVECPDCFGWIAGWPRLPVPLVLRAHGSLTFYAHELGKPVNPMGHRLEKWSYRRADAWSAVSNHAGYLTARVFELDSGPDAILYNPIDAPSVVPPFATRSLGRVLFTGTLTHRKGIVSLFNAWSMVRQQHSEAELHVYGKDGSAEGGLTMQNYLLNLLPPELRESVKFYDHVPRQEVMIALARARVAVFPSYSETFGFGPVESMASGCPTIYTKLTCGPEIIEHGLDGLLIDPDQPREIADAILKLLRDDTTAQKVSEAGRARVLRSFTMAQVIPANEAFFSGAIDSFHRIKSHGGEKRIKECQV